MAGEKWERERVKKDGYEGQIMYNIIGHFKHSDFAPEQMRMYVMFQAEEWHQLNYIKKKNLSHCVLWIDLSGQT